MTNIFAGDYWELSVGCLMKLSNWLQISFLKAVQDRATLQGEIPKTLLRKPSTGRETQSSRGYLFALESFK